MEEDKLSKLAIQAALDGNWEQARELNTQSLRKNPEDHEALNRLARACSELGDKEKAKNCYAQVLKIDPANSIAVKNLKLLTKSQNDTNGKNGSAQQNGKNGNGKNLTLDIFLSEPGRTKLVNLVNLATPATLSHLTCGEKVKMVLKKRQVVIESSEEDYLGAIPDDLSHYLISLTEAGNLYESYVKAIKTNALTILIWEKTRAAKFTNQPSFPLRRRLTLPKKVTESAMTEVEFVESFFEVSEL